MTDLLEQSEQLRDQARRELERARRRQREIRAELAAADAEVTRLRNVVQSLGALLGDDEPEPLDPNALSGWRVGEVALAILEDAGEPLHYTEVWKRMQANGDVVESDDPAAVVLTNLTRHPDVERCGRGTYRARSDA